MEELLQVLGQEGQQQVPCPSWHYQDHDEQAQSADIPRQLPLQEALVKCYDLRSVSAISAPDAAGNQQTWLDRLLRLYPCQQHLSANSGMSAATHWHRVKQEHKTCC